MLNRSSDNTYKTYMDSFKMANDTFDNNLYSNRNGLNNSFIAYNLAYNTDDKHLQSKAMKQLSDTISGGGSYLENNQYFKDLFEASNKYDYKNDRFTTNKRLVNKFQPEILALQKELNSKGVKDRNGNTLKEDGINGPNTLWAIDNSNTEKDNYLESKSDKFSNLSTILSIASLIPAIGTPADIASAGIDIINKDYMSAGINLLGVLPIVGDVAGAVKIADNIKDTVNVIDSVNDTSKVLDVAHDTAQTLKYCNPSDIKITHKLTMSKSEFIKLADDIKENGIKETIKYIEIDGEKYVVDGHHRLSVAKKLKIDNIPIEKVELPYKGYKTVDDLMWLY